MQEIKISQLGEGLTEVRVVAILKAEGDTLEKDEPLLEVETDKAIMQIESPYSGRLAQWLIGLDDHVPVGGTVALIEATVEEPLTVPESESEPVVAEPAAPSSPQLRNKNLSPREKARLKQIQAETEGSTQAPTPPSETTTPETNTRGGQPWTISPRQARLSHLLLESEKYVAEAWLSMQLPWDDLSRISRRLRGLDGLQYRPTPLELIAWSALETTKSHPQFRLLNTGERGYEMHPNAAVGLSIALPEDELGIAGVTQAAGHSLTEFIRVLRANVAEAQAGHVAPGRYPLLISYMVQQGVNMAAPRLIMPSVATLFVGSPFDIPTKAEDGSLQWQRVANMVLTFDHRVINGAGAAAFLKEMLGFLSQMAPVTESPEK